MSEYIEREAAIEALENTDWYHQSESKSMVLGANSSEHQAWYKEQDVYAAIKSIPAADVRPVKQGKWNRTDAYPHRIYCSACYKTYLQNDEWLERWEFPMDFCPSCGANMKEASE